MKQLMVATAITVALCTAVFANPNYNLNWYVVDGGGDIAASSASFRMGLSAAQPAAGEAIGPSLRLRMGFWYGARSCRCPYQGDYDANAVLDPLDLNALIDALFFGGANPQDPSCPTSRGDVNNDGVPDPLDLNYLIDHLFFSGPAPVDPCGG